jgi:hypothetical protein
MRLKAGRAGMRDLKHAALRQYAKQAKMRLGI